MSERVAVWRAAAAAARSDHPAALATVARRRGSLPMASDAKMLVTREGHREGTVGGGCLEADVTAQALAALDTGRPALVRHTLNADVAGDLGLSCGGTVELFLEPVVRGTAAAALYEAAAECLDARRRGSVHTALDWRAGPRKMLASADRRVVLGGWEVEAVAATGAAHLDESAGVFVEPIPRVPRLLIFGAGHVGREIARAAAGTDFHVVVIDDRDEFANPARFPDAHAVVVADHRGYLDDAVLDADDYVVVCTRGHAMDAVIVERVAGTSARYVGMLGSQRKRAVIWKALEQAGIPRSALERVKVPIGDAIGADTPGEIGIAVMAELIRLRRTS